jgi:tRNA-specific 2-thiouridylase
MQRNKTVFVGLSGGVDSSVAAKRLIDHNYNVVGVFIKVWHPDFMVCNWEQERLDAMRVAAHLGIPFLTCDAEAEYRDDVAKYFIEEYKAGRTPNPDVMCNQHVKFGAFMRFAKAKKADFIATGHYAQRKDKDLNTEMHRGIDQGKDQTYFLWTLSKEQLEFSLFPVGDTPKEKIREEAEKAGIPTAAKKDSQGICFLGHVDIPEFLSHYMELVPGNILDEAGNTIGKHKGSLVYTLGQRHGFSIEKDNSSRKPVYVTKRDTEANTITVSADRPFVDPKETIELESVVLRSDLSPGDKLQAQFRYRQEPFIITVIKVDDTKVSLKTELDTERPAVGQSCVLYRGTHCLGGGIIQ